jgi:2'-5' RNA ligase
VRCFVAVWPSTQVVRALAGLPRPAVERLRWSSEDQWHVTLRFFGELSPAQVDEACRALEPVAGPWPEEVAVQGGPATRFLGPGLIVWPVAGLGPLAGAVAKATARIGQPVPDRPFVGHLTIARGARGTDLRTAPHHLAPLAASWRVTSLSLVRSELDPRGARYRDLRAFPLGVPGPAR